MITLKTKSEKHANDNKKRRQSLKEREKTKLNQSLIIKNALSNSAIGNSSNKVIFNDFESEPVDGKNGKRKSFEDRAKPVLFDSSESESEDFEIREKAQFSGKKGFELLNLQSTYGNDERFKIDKRFLEDEKDDFNEEPSKTNNEKGNFSKEKAEQFHILGSVLGTPMGEPEKEKKRKKRTYEMIRYDASQKEHEIYEIKTPMNGRSSISNKEASTSTKEKKRIRISNQDSSKPKVSKEKFYDISKEIKNHFKGKDDGGQFSLLQTYGLNGVVNKETKDKDIELNNDVEGDQDGFIDRKNFSDEQTENVEEVKEVNKPKEDKKSTVAQGIWKESFFFVKDDARFQEALQFINKKGSAEAGEAAKNYDKTRRKLKEILRLYLKKQMHKKDPFKNKVGGMNKKQLANSKFKNTKIKFNKKK